MRAKAAATGPLDHHVLELRRREEALKRDMVNDAADTNYRSCSELRLDGGLGKRDMVNDAADTNYRSCSEHRLDGGLDSSHGEHSLRRELET